MSRRTKLKVRNMRLFLAKNVFNSRYIVRNILAFTIMVTVVASCVGAALVIGDKKAAKKAETAVATGYVEEVVTLDGSVVAMNPSGTNMLRADLESVMTAGKEAKENIRGPRAVGPAVGGWGEVGWEGAGLQGGV